MQGALSPCKLQFDVLQTADSDCEQGCLGAASCVGGCRGHDATAGVFQRSLDVQVQQLGLLATHTRRVNCSGLNTQNGHL